MILSFGLLGSLLLGVLILNQAAVLTWIEGLLIGLLLGLMKLVMTLNQIKRQLNLQSQKEFEKNS